MYIYMSFTQYSACKHASLLPDSSTLFHTVKMENIRHGMSSLLRIHTTVSY